MLARERSPDFPPHRDISAPRAASLGWYHSCDDRAPCHRHGSIAVRARLLAKRNATRLRSQQEIMRPADIPCGGGRTSQISCMGMWHLSQSLPPAPGVYRVLISFPSAIRPTRVRERFARWTGEYWCCWAPTVQRARCCEWRGPSAGYLWGYLDASFTQHEPDHGGARSTC